MRWARSLARCVRRKTRSEQWRGIRRVHAARQARAARHGTSVLRSNKTQEEAAILEEADKGEALPNTREELRRRAKLGARDAPCTGGARGCRATKRQRLMPTSNGNNKDEPFPTKWRDQTNRQGQARATVARSVAALGRRIGVQRQNAQAERG